MQSNDAFSEWAGLFLQQYETAETRTDPAGPLASDSGTTQPGVLTIAAQQLLMTVDAGGVPAFVSNNLRQIAADNGIQVSAEWTPNDIIAALKEKLRAGEAGAQ